MPSLGDIDAIYNALRPRLKKLVENILRNWNGSIGSGSGTIGPHTHSADQITYEPASVTGADITSEECQSSQEELLSEKLARSGQQPMLGNLDMNGYQIEDILDLHMSGGAGNAILDGVRNVTFKGTTVGEDVIANCRILHMIGDADNSEGRIDGLDDVIFNATPTQARIRNLGHIRWQTGVTPGTDYTRAVGYQSWSDLEKTMVCVVASGE